MEIKFITFRGMAEQKITDFFKSLDYTAYVMFLIAGVPSFLSSFGISLLSIIYSLIVISILYIPAAILERFLFKNIEKRSYITGIYFSFFLSSFVMIGIGVISIMPYFTASPPVFDAFRILAGGLSILGIFVLNPVRFTVGKQACAEKVGKTALIEEKVHIGKWEIAYKIITRIYNFLIIVFAWCL